MPQLGEQGDDAHARICLRRLRASVGKQRAADGDRVGLEVDVAPLEPSDLAQPKPAEARERERGLPSLRGRGGDQLPDGRAVEALDVRALRCFGRSLGVRPSTGFLVRIPRRTASENTPLSDPVRRGAGPAGVARRRASARRRRATSEAADLLHLLALERGEVPIEVVALVFCGSLTDGSPLLPLLEHLGERRAVGRCDAALPEPDDERGTLALGFRHGRCLERPRPPTPVLLVSRRCTCRPAGRGRGSGCPCRRERGRVGPAYSFVPSLRVTWQTPTLRLVSVGV